MTGFESALAALLPHVQLEFPLGLQVEVDHFVPEGWSYSVKDGVCTICGPAGPGWTVAVHRLIGILAYQEGHLVRRTAPHTWEMYTWRNVEGHGFKLVFTATSP